MKKIMFYLIISIFIIACKTVDATAGKTKKTTVTPKKRNIKVVYRIKKGDTLWDISKKKYKNPFLWRKIWRENMKSIKNPNRIYPNRKIVIPK